MLVEPQFEFTWSFAPDWQQYKSMVNLDLLIEQEKWRSSLNLLPLGILLKGWQE